MADIFFGYDSRPSVNREAIHRATKRSTTRLVDMNVVGRPADRWTDSISTICDEIDKNEFGVFDLTTLNPNVLFELGYAITWRRHIRILLEKANSSASLAYKRLALLRTVGYFGWTDAASIVGYVVGETTSLSVAPLGDNLVDRAATFDPSAVFFIPSLNRSEPDTHAKHDAQVRGRRGDRTNRRSRRDSPRVFSLVCRKSLFMFSVGPPLRSASPKRARNAQCTSLVLVAGMCHGLGRPLLMLADEEYEVPLDYQDILKRYRSASEAQSIVESWMDDLDLEPSTMHTRPHLDLAVELKTLRL